jgi:hypothetical protein
MKKLIFTVLVFLSVFATCLYFTEHSSFSSSVQAAGEITQLYNSYSPFNRRIPSSATYTRDGRIGTLRQAADIYSMPILRVANSKIIPLVNVTNYYGRSVQWPIPTAAVAASGSDGHMAVMAIDTRKVYEMWQAKWVSSTTLQVGSMKDFSVDGNGISNPPNEAVSGAGFAITAGMVVKEDFLNTTTNKLDSTQAIGHALSVTIPARLIERNAFVAPAVKGETASDATGTIPMGMLFALPRGINIDSMPVHPLTKALAKAARDYGMYIIGRNNTNPYNDTGVATVKIEPGVVDQVFGQGNDELMNTVMAEMYDIVKKYGVYRVTGIDFSYVNQPQPSYAPGTVTTSPSPTPQPTASPKPTPSPTPTPSPSPSPKPTPSPTPVTTQTTVTLSPTQDGYVRKTEPTLADGKGDTLKIGGTTEDITYLRFNLSGYADKKIVSAKLRFFVTNPSTGLQGIFSVDDILWGESNLNYNNKPVVGKQFTTLDTQGSSGWVEKNITTYAQSKNGTVFSIALHSFEADGLWVSSRETTNKPQLVVTFE